MLRSCESASGIDIIHFSAVEATTELDDGLALLQCIVLLAELIRGDAQLLGSIHGVEDQAIFHDLAPLHSEPCSTGSNLNKMDNTFWKKSNQLHLLTC